MKASLSILLPVHNVESTLRHEVLRVLEVAGELTDRLEVLIFDDSSTDQTLEVAHELAMCYPQINVVHHRVRCGLGPIIETGLAHTAGDMVMVHDGVGSIDVAEIPRLWQLRDDQPQVSRDEVGIMPGSLSSEHDHPTRCHGYLGKLKEFALGE